MFLENFLAEVGYGIAFVSLFFFSRYKGGSKWKKLSVVIFIIMSPFYLSLHPDFQFFNFSEIVFVIIWIFLIPIGGFILFNNVKAAAYSSVLNSPKLKQKPLLKTNKNLSMKLKDLGLYTNIVLASVLVSILFLPWHQSIELIQIPLQLIGIIALLGVASFYYANDKNSLKRKMRVTIIAFLSSIYLTMSYAFLYLIQYLYLFLHLNLIICIVSSSLMFGLFFYFIEKHLRSIRDILQASARNRSILEMFSKYFIRNAIIMLLLILIFSDSLMVYTIFLEEHIGMMILWTTSFIFFISRFYFDALSQNLSFKIQMGLLEQTDLENQFNTLSGKRPE